MRNVPIEVKSRKIKLGKDELVREYYITDQLSSSPYKDKVFKTAKEARHFIEHTWIPCWQLRHEELNRYIAIV